MKKKDSYCIVRALHIEVPRAKKNYIYKRLGRLFSVKNVHLLGHRLLMVPIIRDTTSSHKIIKIIHLIRKQTQFLSKIKTAKLWDFDDIDVVHPKLDLSARGMLMDLTTLDGTDTRVFLGIDYNKKDECCKVTFAKSLDTQVRDILAQLPSLLVYLYEDQALELMTDAAQESGLDASWDEDAYACTGKNKHDDVDKFQWRGTAIMSFDLLAQMTRSTGVDESGLGRWSWLLLEGHRKQGRVISDYNLCRTQTNQLHTVYSQHKRYFLSQKEDVCP